MKDTLNSPQVVAALITSTVAIVLALAPMILNNSATASPTEPAAPITVVDESIAEHPTDEPVPTEKTVDIPTATNDPLPTETPIIVPTSTSTVAVVPTETSMPATEPPPANVLLAYDDVSFTIYNQSSQTLSVNDLQFRSSSANWDAVKWGESLASNFQANNCLRIRDINSGQRQPPSFCGTLLGLQLVDTSLLFWVNTDEFEVRHNGALIATCSTTNETCPIFVAYP